MIQEDFTNHCKDATQELGQRLATRFGDEESFFDLVPDATFDDVRSYAPLSKLGYRGDYHSVAMLELQQGQQPGSVLIDLTYSTVSPDAPPGTALVLYAPGKTREAMAALHNHYGGAWKIELKLDPKTCTFVFRE